MVSKWFPARWLASASSRQPRQRKKPASRRRRLSMEQLEERLTPATPNQLYVNYLENRLLGRNAGPADLNAFVPTLDAVPPGADPTQARIQVISEITGSWIDDIGPKGNLRWAVRAPVSYPSDPQLLQPGRILLADYANPGHVLIMTSRGKVLWRYGPSSGPGKLDHPSLATRLAPGLVAITDDYNDRVVVVNIHTNTIVWQYGHDGVPGTAPGYLSTPDGLDLLPYAAAMHLPAVRRLIGAARR